ncbi:FtsX-like permease family protein [Buchnera aphidicola]|uniref:FtsX-like permease family protein n=1 Tax=Buchnera aphidicola TaxID=9 RepID=UPI003463A32A
MNYLPFILSQRFYRPKKINFSTKLITIISQIGISTSIFALLISLSALNGFQVLLNKNILSTLPHGVILLKNPSPLKWTIIKKKIESVPGISYVTRHITFNGLLKKNKIIKLVQIKSFSGKKDLKKYFSHKNNQNYFNVKKNNKYDVFISSSLAKILRVKENDWINLIIFNQENHFVQSSFVNFPIKIKSIFTSQEVLSDNVILMPLNFFTNLSSINKTFAEIEIHMSHPFQADSIILDAAKRIKEPVAIYTWMKTYKDFYHDIQKIKITIYCAISIVIIISCLSTVSISFISILKKTKEIAILRSMGANNSLIQLIFLCYGLRFVVSGIFFGLLIGIITILNFENIIFFLKIFFKNTIFLNDLHLTDYLLLKLHVLDVITILIVTIIIGILTNIYPSYYATTINPSKVLKEN